MLTVQKTIPIVILGGATGSLPKCVSLGDCDFFILGHSYIDYWRHKMKKKTKKDKQIAKLTQLKVRTGIKSGLGEKCCTDADCPDDFAVCFNEECVIWL